MAPAPMESTGSNSISGIGGLSGVGASVAPGSVVAPAAVSTSPDFGSGGRSSSSEPVSLSFTSAAPDGPKRSTVHDAGETNRRWNRSRCTPV